MSTSPAHYRKPATRCVTALTPFLRHLNTGTLAFVLFVALALLSTTRGMEPETRESHLAKITNSELIIDKQQDDLPHVGTTWTGKTMPPRLTLCQSTGRAVN